MSVESCTKQIPTVLIPTLPIFRNQSVKRCEKIINIGLFFDGTGNNRQEDLPGQKHSNVARLFDAYREEPDAGFFRYYVEGVGTYCNLVNDPGGTMAGGAFGSGGKARILLGLLHVLNSLYRFVEKNKKMFEDSEIKLLCSEAPHGSYKMTGDGSLHEQLRQTAHLYSGLLCCNSVELTHFFVACAQLLKGRLADPATRPTVAAIYLDVVGFSRGAAQARVFANWLNEFMMNAGDADSRCLFGVPSYIRFLGLFDTVASVVGSPVGLLLGSGHDDWATLQNLKIPPRPVVQHCVHYVALHEFRSNFPADSVYPEGRQPNNCHERIAPGSHSDLGGGYAPGEQGKAVEEGSDGPRPADDYKLSQFYLNEMLSAARQSSALCGPESSPWLEELDSQAVRRDMQRQFGCDPRIRSAIADYFDECGVAQCATLDIALQEHGMRYLAWRYQLLRHDTFQALPSVRHAPLSDPKWHQYYLLGQQLFAEQVRHIQDQRQPYFHQAPAMLKRMAGMTVTLKLGMFFDWWIHDSFAGFLAPFGGHTIAFKLAEPHGYIRHRVLYMGLDERGREQRLNASLQQPAAGLTTRHA